MITDEILFYGGIGVAGVTLVIAVLLIFLLQIKKIKLKAQFDAEYGPEWKFEGELKQRGNEQ